MTDYNLSDWNESDSNNDGVQPNGVQGGYPPSAIAGIIRAIRGAAKRDYVRSNATVTTTGTATAYVLTYGVAPSAYVKGFVYRFYAHITNTGAATLNINGLGAKAIFSQHGVALTAGQIPTNRPIELVYDGTQFQLIGNETHDSKFTGTLTAATANVTTLFANTANVETLIANTATIAALTATTLAGNGSALTSLNAAALTTGSVPSARIAGSYNDFTNITSGTLRLTATADASEVSTAHGLQIGPDNGVNLRIDPNEILTVNNGVAGGALYIQNGITFGANAVLGIVDGGTGGTTAATAKTNLGLVAVASSGSAADLTTGTLPSARIAGSYTGLVGTGALNAGSITSGFGNINIGTAGFTGNTIRLLSTSDASETSTGHAFQIGPDTAGNIIQDTNEFVFRNNGALSTDPFQFVSNGAWTFYGTGVTAANALNTSGALTITSSAPNIRFIDTTANSYSARMLIDSNNIRFDSSTDDVTFGEVFRFELDTKIGYVANSRIWTDSYANAAKLNAVYGYTPVNPTRNIIAGAGLSGGGTLGADRTIWIGTPSSISGTSTNSATGTTHTHELTLVNADITGALGFVPVGNARNLVAGNGLTGGGNLTADRTFTLGTPSDITNSTTNSVTSTSHTHALGFTASEVYTGSTADNLVFPIGAIVMFLASSQPTRNSTVTIRIDTGNDSYYTTSGSGGILTGTWRVHGYGGGGVSLGQRVA